MRRASRFWCMNTSSILFVYMLCAGVKKFGKGKWKEILAAYKFHDTRGPVDLKDKWRNEEKKIERRKKY